MPELPEVETYRKQLEAHLLGRRIRAVRVLDVGVLEGVSRSRLPHALRGARVLGLQRHGKVVFARAERPGRSPVFVVLRFGMTGGIAAAAPGAPLPAHARVVFDLEDHSAVVFEDQRKFGRIDVVESPAAWMSERRMGPDALSAGLPAFVAAVRRHPRIAIKPLLLDQRLLAGVGNLYADEALFRAGIHPARRASELDEASLRALHAAVRRVLTAVVRLDAEWERLPRGWLLRSREAGSPCPRCRQPLAALRLGGRTAVYCPACQPAFSPPGSSRSGRRRAPGRRTR